MNVCAFKRGETYIFGEDLLQRLSEQVPFKNLEILLDVSRFGVGELHDALEKLTKAGLVLRYCGGTETLQIAPDAVLFLYGKFAVGETFEKVDDIDGGDEARIRFLAVDAGDDAVRLTKVLLHDGFAGDDEAPAVLDLCEADEATGGCNLGLGPTGAYGGEGSDQVENGGLCVQLLLVLDVTCMLFCADEGLRLHAAVEPSIPLLRRFWERRTVGSGG